MVDVLRSMNTNASMKVAITQALSLWEMKTPVKYYDKKKIVDDKTFFTLTAKENGFLVQKIEGNFDLIKQLELPAMIGFTVPGNMRPKYLALSTVDDSKLVFLTSDPNHKIELSHEKLLQVWAGVAYVPWKNFFDYRGTTPISGPVESTIILKKMLRNIGYTDLNETSIYDEKTKAAVKEIQSEHTLPADGFVGPLTKIILYRLQPDLSIPNLRSK